VYVLTNWSKFGRSANCDGTLDLAGRAGLSPNNKSETTSMIQAKPPKPQEIANSKNWFMMSSNLKRVTEEVSRLR
jgi:hypothetical protein